MKFIILLGLIFFRSLFAAATLPPLVVGMELSYPPFETIDVFGRPKGVSVDLAHALGEYLDRKVVIYNIPYVGLIPSLQTKKIDVILSSMTVTPEREKVLLFSAPYLSTGLCLLLSNATTADTIDALDRPEYIIVVKMGTTGEAFARAHIKNAQVRALNQEAACVLEVVQEKANAFIYDQFSIFRNWQNHKEMTHANLVPFKRESWAMGLRKEDTELQVQINAFIEAFRKNLGFEKLEARYFSKEKQVLQQMGIPFIFD